MTTSLDIPLSATSLNRAGHHRTDPEWLGAAIMRQDVYVLLMQSGRPLVEQGEAGEMGPVWLGPQAAGLVPDVQPLFLGLDREDAPVFAIDLPEDFDLERSAITGLGDFEDMRAAVSAMTPFNANACATARSLFEWHRKHGFCSNCGTPSEIVEAGWKRLCPECATEHFPRTDPVAIMLAVKGEKCLLGRGAGWPAGYVSCLAGFVEPGESFEQAAARELEEEAGIRADVASAEYLYCQPWPFPSSLMIGLILEAENEDITIDPNELESARWFTRAEARQIIAGEHDEIYAPPPLAIAHHILKTWSER